MAKKIDKFSGMKDMFAKQESDDKIRAFEIAKAKLEQEIRVLESGIDNEYDNGLGTIEDRNELNALNNELRYINEQIAKLRTNNK